MDRDGRRPDAADDERRRRRCTPEWSPDGEQDRLLQQPRRELRDLHDERRRKRRHPAHERPGLRRRARLAAGPHRTRPAPEGRDAAYGPRSCRPSASAPRPIASMAPPLVVRLLLVSAPLDGGVRRRVGPKSIGSVRLDVVHRRDRRADVNVSVSLTDVRRRIRPRRPAGDLDLPSAGPRHRQLQRCAARLSHPARDRQGPQLLREPVPLHGALRGDGRHLGRRRPARCGATVNALVPPSVSVHTVRRATARSGSWARSLVYDGGEDGFVEKPRRQHAAGRARRVRALSGVLLGRARRRRAGRSPRGASRAAPAGSARSSFRAGVAVASSEITSSACRAARARPRSIRSGSMQSSTSTSALVRRAPAGSPRPARSA